MIDKWQQQIKEKVEAERLIYYRLIVDNRQLQSDLQQIRLEYGFPLNDMSAVCDWLDQHKNTERRLSDALNALLLRHNIPEKWRYVLFYSILLGNNNPVGPVFSMGFPVAQYENQKVVFKYTTDVLRDNPIVRNYIAWRLTEELKETIPHPIKTGTNNRLDWQPVFEWFLNHPGETKEQRYKLIADKLGYATGYVKKKLTGLSGDILD